MGAIKAIQSHCALGSRSFAASSGSVVIVDTVGARSSGGVATVGGEATTAGGAQQPLRAAKRRALFELLQAIEKFLGSLRRVLIGHIDKRRSFRVYPLRGSSLQFRTLIMEGDRYAILPLRSTHRRASLFS